MVHEGDPGRPGGRRLPGSRSPEPMPRKPAATGTIGSAAACGWRSRVRTRPKRRGSRGGPAPWV